MKIWKNVLGMGIIAVLLSFFSGYFEANEEIMAGKVVCAHPSYSDSKTDDKLVLVGKERADGSTILSWNNTEGVNNQLDDSKNRFFIYGSTDKDFLPSEKDLIAGALKDNVFIVSTEMKEKFGDVINHTIYYKIYDAFSNIYSNEVQSVTIHNEISVLTGTPKYSAIESISIPGTDFKVGVCNGNLNFVTEGTELASGQLSVSLFPTYNSLMKSDGFLGKSWMLSIERYLVFDGNNIVFIDETGQKYIFDGEKEKKSRTMTGAVLRSEKREHTFSIGDTKYKVSSCYQIEKEKNIDYFDQWGRLIASEDSEGSFVLHFYEGYGNQLSRTVTFSGKTIQYDYIREKLLEGKARLSSITLLDASGNSIGLGLTFGYHSDRIDEVNIQSKMEKQTVRYNYNGDLIHSVIGSGDKKADFLWLNEKLLGVTTSLGDKKKFIYKKEKTTVETYYDDLKISNYSYEYDDQGRIEKTKDNNGLIAIYSYGKSVYDEYQLIASKYEQSYQDIENEIVQHKIIEKKESTIYTKDGMIESQTREDGSKIEYKYDDSQNIHFPTFIKRIDGEGNVSKEKFEYDSAGRVVYEEKSENGEVVSTEYHYDKDDDSGRVLKKHCITNRDGVLIETIDIEYDLEGNKIRQECASGERLEKRRYKYDELGRIIKEIDDIEKVETNYSYDCFGRLEKKEIKYLQGTLAGRVESEKKEYDCNGNLIQVTENGVVTRYKYDEENRLVEENINRGEKEGKVKRVNYSYEDVMIYGGDRIYESIHNAFVTTITDGDGEVIEKKYVDGNDQVVRSYKDGIYTDYSYDLSGHNIVQCVVGKKLPKRANSFIAEKNVILNMYDKDGNPIMSIRNPDITHMQYGIGKKSLITKKSYDNSGNLLSETDEEGHITRYSYEDGKLSHVIKADGTEGNSYQYNKDYSGSAIKNFSLNEKENNKKGKLFADVTTDARGKISNLIKNEAGQILAIEDVAPDGKQNIIAYEYDESGKVLKETYGTGSYVIYQYDAKGQKQCEKVFDSNGEQTIETDFNYDINGNVTKMVDYKLSGEKKTPVRITLSGYDEFQRRISFAEIDNTDAPSVKQVRDASVSYTYDANDRVTEIKYMQNSSMGGLKFFYNSQGWLSKIIGKKTDGKDITLKKYTYDDYGNVKKTITTLDYLQGGTDTVVERYDYDDYGRIVSMSLKNANESVLLQKFCYSYDKLGNIIKKKEINSFESDERNKEIFYQYDALGELVSSHSKVVGMNGKEKTYISEYQYDGAGNRVLEKTNQEVTHYVYNGLNQLTMVEYGETGDKISYKYDDAGNQIEKIETNREMSAISDEQYGYDGKNRLVSVSKKVGDGRRIIQKNYYNGNNQRIKKIENDEEIDYFYQGRSVLYTTGDKGNIRQMYIYGNERSPLGMTECREGGDKSFVFSKDIQESVINILDESGESDTLYEYSDFGITTINGNQDNLNEIAYTGGLYDKAIGQYYLNERYYAPCDGNFLSMDTYRGEKETSSTWNLYSYCGGNPISCIDPSGHAAEWISKDKGTVNQTNVRALRICTDGKVTKAMKQNNYYGDKNHQNRTACFGDDISADNVPYIVVPPSKSNYKFSVGVIVNKKTNDYIYCVVAEVGAEKRGMGEVSIYAAWQITGTKKKNIGNEDQKGSWKIIMFEKSSPNPKKRHCGWTAKDSVLRSEVVTYGKKCYKGVGVCKN